LCYSILTVRSIWVVSWLCGQINTVKTTSAGMTSLQSGLQELIGCFNRNMTKNLSNLFLEWYIIIMCCESWKLLLCHLKVWPRGIPAAGSFWNYKNSLQPGDPLYESLIKHAHQVRSHYFCVTYYSRTLISNRT